MKRFLHLVPMIATLATGVVAGCSVPKILPSQTPTAQHARAVVEDVSAQDEVSEPQVEGAASDITGTLAAICYEDLLESEASEATEANTANKVDTANEADTAKLLPAPDPQPAPQADPQAAAIEASDPPFGPKSLADVITSIHATYPLLAVAYQTYEIAAGNQTAAWGAFDTKLTAASQNGPLGYYRTYRNLAGFATPLYQGGEVFGGYRIGRGQFQPWYLERQTNAGGEFNAGFSVPLLKDRTIDARRAELWRANFERQAALPEIRTQLIEFVREGSIIYWTWVAAGMQYQIGLQALQLAERRNQQLERKVQLGDIAPPVLQDNLRAIAQREAKLIDLQRKHQQAAVKLSLYYRTADGAPIVPETSQSVLFPQAQQVTPSQMEQDLERALEQRPEFAALEALVRRVNVDLREAQNEMLPALDAQVIGSQDVGAPVNLARTKSQFELEAGVFFEVPAQRRKAIGKYRAAQAKLTQLAAKRQFTTDKVRTELQAAFVALEAAYRRVERARESRRLSDYMAEVERRKFGLGESDLFAVVLREQYAIEAAVAEVETLYEYFVAKADYDAAMARDWPE